MILLLRLLFLGISLSAIVSYFTPLFHGKLFLHGKLETSRVSDACEDSLILRVLSRFGIMKQISKSWFIYFYIWGALWNLIFLARLVLAKDLSEPFICLGLFEFHLIRRIIECRFIQSYSANSKMLIGHFIVGILFYTALPLAIVLDTHESSNTDASALLPISMFVYASYNQFRCHVVLSRLREKKNSLYVLPMDSWFRETIAPHYGFEIMIYTALVTILHGRNLTLMCALVWVIINLALLSIETKRWYLKKWPDKSELIAKKFRLIAGLF